MPKIYSLPKTHLRLGKRLGLQCRASLEMRHNEPELQVLSILKDKNLDFLDVGANRGVYAAKARQNFRRVICIEPVPSTVDLLIAAFGDRVDIVVAALSDHEGVGRIWMPIDGSTDVPTRASLQETANPGFRQRQIAATVMTLDSLALNELALVKIDVEGHELAVLRGAEDTIDHCRPVFIVESEERHNPGGVEAVFAFFRERKYEVWFLDRAQWRPGVAFDLKVHQAPSAVKRVGEAQSPHYVNNFVMVPTERIEDVGRRLGLPREHLLKS